MKWKVMYRVAGETTNKSVEVEAETIDEALDSFSDSGVEFEKIVGCYIVTEYAERMRKE